MTKLTLRTEGDTHIVVTRRFATPPEAVYRAHTEASNLPGHALDGQRIVNTQDTLHAALVPALCILALWALAAWAQGRRTVCPRTGKVASSVASGLAAITAG